MFTFFVTYPETYLTMTTTPINAAVAIATNASAVLQMLDLFDEFATDTALETGGAWVPYKNGTEFLIARAGNEAYGEAITKALSENREALEKNDDDAKALSERLMLQVQATTVLKGWRVKRGDQTLDYIMYKGQSTFYSPEVAAELLKMTDFRQWVRRQSDNRDYYKAKLVEEAAKN